MVQEQKTNHDAVFMEKKTNILYDVKYFPDYVIVRPVSPSMYSYIRKMSYSDLSERFEESFVDVKALRARVQKGGDDDED